MQLQLKVGDKVKVLHAVLDSNLIGKVCTVKSLDNGMVMLHESIGWWGNDNSASDYLELIETPITWKCQKNLPQRLSWIAGKPYCLTV